MQLPLDINIHEHQTLENYCWQGNELLKHEILLALNNQGERFFYLWGHSGVGKTHILQAITQKAEANAIYLPMEQLLNYGQAVFEDMEQLDIICLDDIEAIAKYKELEEALFHLYNKIRDNGKTRLFLAGQFAIKSLPLELPDLRSRVGWGLVFHLEELTEQDKLWVLSHQAEEKGLELSPSVGQYLITHCARDMHQLKQLIDKLDKASLAAQRKLTVPFVKQALNL